MFGPAVMYPDGLVRDDSPLSPSSTIYGVYKQANEWSGKVYAAISDLPSVGLRPFIVYGPGRDQGMTSGPSVAILSAVTGVPFHVPYGGHNLFHFGEDVLSGERPHGLHRAQYSGHLSLPTVPGEDRPPARPARKKGSTCSDAAGRKRRETVERYG